MIVFFGECNSDGSLKKTPDGTDTDYGCCQKNTGDAGAAFICPGSGPQNVVSLDLYAASADGNPGNGRCAIYDSSGNLVCEGSASFEISSTTPGWYGHTVFNGSPNLVGGEAYFLVFCFSAGSSNLRYYYDAVSNGAAWGYGDYSSSDWPGTIPTMGSVYSNLQVIRCGVEPAPAGLSIPVAMRAYRNLREI